MMMTTAVVGVLAAGPTLASGVLVPIVLVTGSTETDVFGINDSEVITGSWYDSSNAEHGYVGSIFGSNYTTFDDPTAPGTEPRGINNGGYITGFDNSKKGNPSKDIPFERTPDGTITNVTKDGQTLNYLIQGINNNNNVFAGGYIANSVYIGYTGANAQYTKNFTLKGITNTGYAGRGINDKGDIVGWYYDANGAQNGFLLSRKTAVTLDYPSASAVSTVLEGINDRGQITGQWTDSRGIIHGFVYDSATKSFRKIKVPGSSSFVQPWGINSKGLVALGSDAGDFVWCPSVNNCINGATTVKPQRPTRELLPKLP